MKKVIIILVFCLSAIIQAQDNKKIKFGGSVSADFGRFNNRIEVMPTLHKKIASKLYAGIGVTVAYYNQKSTNAFYTENDVFEVTGKTKTVYYGGSLFLRYYTFEHHKSPLLHNLYFQTELEYLKGNSKYKDDFYNESYTTKNTTWFAGFGYRHRIANKLMLSTSLLFKLNEQTNSPYKNPLFRIGFEF